jgi:CheY-like chemotaxis protein
VSKLIVVAEDHDDSARILLTFLQHYGYATAHARDGKTALDLCRTRMPALILLDISMPEIDGLEVCRALKADEATRGICVVMQTAHALPPNRIRALSNGADEFLTKPVEPMHIISTVRRLVGDP